METTAKRKVDPKAYGAFIEQIELEDLWLQSAAIENRYGPNMPEPGRVSIDHRDSRVDGSNSHVPKSPLSMASRSLSSLSRNAC